MLSCHSSDVKGVEVVKLLPAPCRNRIYCFVFVENFWLEVSVSQQPSRISWKAHFPSSCCCTSAPRSVLPTRIRLGFSLAWVAARAHPPLNSLLQRCVPPSVHIPPVIISNVSFVNSKPCCIVNQDGLCGWWDSYHESSHRKLSHPRPSLTNPFPRHHIYVMSR